MMKMKTRSSIAGALLTVIVLCVKSSVVNASYDGYKIYEVTAQSPEQAQFLWTLSQDPKYDFWKESRSLGQSNHILVAPEDETDFLLNLSSRKLASKVVIADVEKLLRQERLERTMTRTAVSVGGVSFSNFMYHSEQMAYLRRLANDYPSLVTVDTIGYSSEGREILSLKISSGASETTTPKPVILIDAGIHCREWIAPPVALYIIQQLVENSNNSALYANVDWVIIPNLNPDGYEYTQNTNRLWRKNRRLASGNNCYGTDLNRNFGYNWMYAGASNNSCSDTYAGTEAFSEPESQALRDWVTANKENVHLYLTFHSYGEWLLYPWGYAAVYPDNAEELQSLGESVASAIEAATTINSSYTVGNSAALLYAAAGASDDWVKSEGVELSYTVELPNGDAPYYFMIPARQIYPVVQETWAGVKVFHQYIEKTFWTDAILRQFTNV